MTARGESWRGGGGGIAGSLSKVLAREVRHARDKTRRWFEISIRYSAELKFQWNLNCG